MLTLLRVHVTPRGSRNMVCGWKEQVLCIKLTAPPVEGSANSMLVKYLAEVLGLKRQSIRLVAGKKSREKTLQVTGLSLEDIKSRLRIA